LYLDACCWNRPFDDQTQSRVHLEAEAVLAILDGSRGRGWSVLLSEVVEFEIEQMPDAERRARVEQLWSADCVVESVAVDARTEARAAALEADGLSGLDAHHVACAEKAVADVLLTTDDQFLRTARRAGNKLRVRVDNPLAWLETLSTNA